MNIFSKIRESRLSNKRHKQYDLLQVDRSAPVPHLGTSPRTEEINYRPSFGNW